MKETATQVLEAFSRTANIIDAETSFGQDINNDRTVFRHKALNVSVVRHRLENGVDNLFQTVTLKQVKGSKGLTAHSPALSINCKKTESENSNTVAIKIPSEPKKSTSPGILFRISSTALS